jgi:hypothetical protein
MQHDPNNKGCGLHIYDPSKFPAIWLMDRCTCPDHQRIRAEVAEAELERIRAAFATIKELGLL